MYFWKISKLESDLITQKVSEREIFLYILISSSLLLITIELCNLFPRESQNVWDYLDSALALLIGIGGTVWAYVWNGGDSGERFAERYFSIGWVIGIRFSAALIFIFPLFLTFWISTDDQELATTWWELLVFEIWYLAYVWRVAVHVRTVARASEELKPQKIGVLVR